MGFKQKFPAFFAKKFQSPRMGITAAGFPHSFRLHRHTGADYYAIAAIRQILDTRLPVFGICLGHQLLGLAAGGKTSKMKFGHHGANHPVQDLDSSRVMITSQNHGFQVDETSLPANVRVTHRSLFDHTVQGIALTDRPAFSFQGHPEASPGPHDVAYLFDRFTAAMQQARA